MGGQRHDPAALPPGKTRYPLYRRLLEPQGPIWTDAENLAPTGLRSPDRPARSESLYRLRYPGPRSELRTIIKKILIQYNGNVNVVSKESVLRVAVDVKED